MIVYEDERWTYREAYKFSSAFANSLINDFGVKKGDRIAIASRNYPEWIFSFIAITSIGAIAVPMNSWWTTKELEYGIKDSDSKILIDDGRVTLEVKKRLSSNTLDCVSLSDGKIQDRKGVNFPGIEINVPVLTKQDELDLMLSLSNKADWIALSFVRSPSDYHFIKEKKN